MTCFIWHLDKKGYFVALGIKVTRENAKDIELEIARTVGKSGEHCPAVSKEMKTWFANPKKKAALEKNLRRRFAKA
ncbi:MAG: hypothetical protein A3K60_00130 [Euryarchaeota archaeon RBG_19FT_COMBO_56_21]|nr:MAG: hypothetical protein A3K60_00130 [Euryarchaeota archaeon RBG_19FT_COMBO_56_21]